MKFWAAEFCVEQVSLPRNGSERNSDSLLLYVFHGTEFRVVFSSGEGSEGNSEGILLFLKVGWPDAPLFSFISYSFIQTIHSHILTSMNIRRGSSPFPHR